MTTADPQSMTIIAILAGLIILGIIVAVTSARRRSDGMRERYGQEYDRTVRSAGSRRGADAELREREQRRKALDIRPLPPGLLEGYRAQWKQVQGRFVDQPGKALWDANNLVSQVMEARGYPMRDFSSRAENLSVDYGPIVVDYRKANAIAAASRDGAASTEQMREAFLLYRSMFDALLTTNETRRVG